jgi:DNA-directed RNA polymerase subunit RPC12/RpoP
MNADESASYTCPECGEEIVVPIDASAGEDQQYVEDCPVCCSPVLLQVHVEPDGEITIRASAE